MEELEGLQADTGQPGPPEPAPASPYGALARRLFYARFDMLAVVRIPATTVDAAFQDSAQQAACAARCRHGPGALVLPALLRDKAGWRGVRLGQTAGVMGSGRHRDRIRHGEGYVTLGMVGGLERRHGG